MNAQYSDRRNSISQISIPKQFLFSCILVVVTFLGLELIVRVVSYVVYDRSPFFLFYGFESFMGDENKGGHSVSGNGYFKFEANRTLRQYGLFKEPTPIQINNIGVRGKDIDVRKMRGKVRIICLGGSSTFGFYARDPFTYPAYLEKLLNKRIGGHEDVIEVVNAGIPHANSDNVRAFFEEELVGFSPDVVTVYSGFNDASYVMDESKLQALLRWMHGHLTLYVAMKKIVASLGGPELYSKWAKYSSATNSAYVDRQVQLHVERYESNLRRIVDVSEKVGAKVVLIKQGVDPINNQKRDKKVPFTYLQEVIAIKGKLLNRQALSADEVSLIIHAALMEALQRVADDKHVAVVDNVQILDRHPEYFASYVHLTEEGNLALAEELADRIGSMVASR